MGIAGVAEGGSVNYENILWGAVGLLVYLGLSWIWFKCFEDSKQSIEQERKQRKAHAYRIEIPATWTPGEYPERFVKFKQENERWDR